MIIFRTSSDIADGPFWATVEEVLWFATRVDYVLGYINEDTNTSFSVPVDREWLASFLADKYPKREVMAHVIEWTDGHSELAIGGWVTAGPKLAVAQVLKSAPAAYARGELFGYVQLNRRDGIAYPISDERVEHNFADEPRGRRVLGKLYEDGRMLIVGGEATYP